MVRWFACGTIFSAPGLARAGDGYGFHENRFPDEFTIVAFHDARYLDRRSIRAIRESTR